MQARPKRVLVAVSVEVGTRPADVERLLDGRLARDTCPHPDTRAIDLLDEHFIEAVGRALYLESHPAYRFAKEDWAEGNASNTLWRERARVALQALRDDLMGITE